MSIILLLSVISRNRCKAIRLLRVSASNFVMHTVAKCPAGWLLDDHRKIGLIESMILTPEEIPLIVELTVFNRR